jgi:transcriptional regulator with XRE-family HTH domain
VDIWLSTCVANTCAAINAPMRRQQKIDPAMTAETGPDADARRAELGRFLRARRVGIDPHALGITTGPRRRATGLLREEVAALAGVSTTWYTYLEQGRRIRPSADVISRLLDVLQLNADERRYVRRISSADPSGAVLPLEDGTAPAVEMVAQLGTAPSPFYAARQNADMVAWNEATTTWYTDFAALPPDRRNMLWWMLIDPLARERLPLWQIEVRDLVGRLRAALPSPRARDERTRQVISDLSATSPEFVTWWDEQYVVEQRTRYRQLRHPQHGIRIFRMTVLHVADDPSLSYVAHVPLESVEAGTDSSSIEKARNLRE